MLEGGAHGRRRPRICGCRPAGPARQRRRPAGWGLRNRVCSLTCACVAAESGVGRLLKQPQWATDAGRWSWCVLAALHCSSQCVLGVIPARTVAFCKTSISHIVGAGMHASDQQWALIHSAGLITVKSNSCQREPPLATLDQSPLGRYPVGDLPVRDGGAALRHPAHRPGQHLAGGHHPGACSTCICCPPVDRDICSRLCISGHRSAGTVLCDIACCEGRTRCRWALTLCLHSSCQQWQTVPVKLNEGMLLSLQGVTVWWWHSCFSLEYRQHRQTMPSNWMRARCWVHRVLCWALTTFSVSLAAPADDAREAG